MIWARRLKVSKKLYIYTTMQPTTSASSPVALPTIINRQNMVMSESPRFI